MLPDSAGTLEHPHLLFTGGKEGRIYVLDRDRMGRFQPGADSQIVQSLPGAVGRMFGIPVYSTTPSISQAPGLVGVFAVNLLVPVALRQCGSAGERFKAKERRI